MVTWKDIVLVNGNYYGMEEKISGKKRWRKYLSVR